MTQPRARARLHPWAVAAIAAFVPVVVLFLLTAPTAVAFAVAVAGAMSWCVWLERNPEDAEQM